VLPLYFLHRRGRRRGAAALVDLLAFEAFWELVTEIYVVSRAGRRYPVFGRAFRNPAAIAFWPLMASLAVLPLPPSPICCRARPPGRS
jgi:hypothetical protein